MTLILAVVFYAGLLALGYYVARWARKSWYPRFMPEMLAVAIVGAIGAVAWIGATHDANHVNRGEPD